MMIDPGNPVEDIASHVPEAIGVDRSHLEALARLARDKYDWTSVGAVLRRELGSLEPVT